MNFKFFKIKMKTVFSTPSSVLLAARSERSRKPTCLLDLHQFQLTQFPILHANTYHQLACIQYRCILDHLPQCPTVASLGQQEIEHHRKLGDVKRDERVILGAGQLDYSTLDCGEIFVRDASLNECIKFAEKLNGHMYMYIFEDK